MVTAGLGQVYWIDLVLTRHFGPIRTILVGKMAHRASERAGERASRRHPLEHNVGHAWMEPARQRIREEKLAA